jgi:SAM-dependent methyltransferase
VTTDRWQLDERTAAAFRDAAAAAVTIIGDTPERVLEAGAGTQSHVRFPGARTVIGIDPSEDAIGRNEDLTDRVVGDVASYPFEAGSFDVVVSTYVLEHVSRPDQVIERFALLARPGGVIVLVIPNVMAAKSVVAKYTPHSFHVFVRRRLMKRPNAGRPGHGPYPTVLHRSLGTRRLRRQFAALSLDVIHEDHFEDGKQRELRKRVHIPDRSWLLLDRTARAVTGGRFTLAQTEMVFVLKKAD